MLSQAEQSRADEEVQEATGSGCWEQRLHGC